MGRLLLFSSYNNRYQICLGPWIQTWYLDHFGFVETLRDQMELNGSIWKYDVNMMWIWCEYDGSMMNGVSCHTPFWSILTLHIKSESRIFGFHLDNPRIPFLPMEPQLDPSKKRVKKSPYCSVEGGSFHLPKPRDPSPISSMNLVFIILVISCWM